MSDPPFISESAILALHEDLLEQSGGPEGENPKLVASIAGYPQQKYHYTVPPPNPLQLAAYYGFAAAKFPAVTDGNKRVALALIDMYLMSSGYELAVSPEESVEIIQALAAGEIGEEDLVAWVSGNAVELIE